MACFVSPNAGSGGGIGAYRLVDAVILSDAVTTTYTMKFKKGDVFGIYRIHIASSFNYDLFNRFGSTIKSKIKENFVPSSDTDWYASRYSLLEYDGNNWLSDFGYTRMYNGGYPWKSYCISNCAITFNAITSYPILLAKYRALQKVSNPQNECSDFTVNANSYAVIQPYNVSENKMVIYYADPDVAWQNNEGVEAYNNVVICGNPLKLDQTPPQSYAQSAKCIIRTNETEGLITKVQNSQSSSTRIFYRIIDRITD